MSYDFQFEACLHLFISFVHLLELFSYKVCIHSKQEGRCRT